MHIYEFIIEGIKRLITPPIKIIEILWSAFI